MKKIIGVLLFFNVACTCSFGQNPQVYRMHVKHTLSRFKYTDGSWGSWVDFLKMDEDDFKITIDIFKKQMFFDMKSKVGDIGIVAYKMTKIDIDSSNNDFGFNIVKMSCETLDKNEISPFGGKFSPSVFYLYQVGKNDVCSVSYFLVEKANDIETKYEIEKTTNHSP